MARSDSCFCFPELINALYGAVAGEDSSSFSIFPAHRCATNASQLIAVILFILSTALGRNCRWCTALRWRRRTAATNHSRHSCRLLRYRHRCRRLKLPRMHPESIIPTRFLPPTRASNHTHGRLLQIRRPPTMDRTNIRSKRPIRQLRAINLLRQPRRNPNPDLAKELIRDTARVAQIKVHLFLITRVQWTSIVEFDLVAVSTIRALVVDLDYDGRTEFFAVALVGVCFGLQVPAFAAAFAYTVDVLLAGAVDHVVGGGEADAVVACGFGAAGDGWAAELVPGEGGGVDGAEGVDAG